MLMLVITLCSFISATPINENRTVAVILRGGTVQMHSYEYFYSISNKKNELLTPKIINLFKEIGKRSRL